MDRAPDGEPGQEGDGRRRLPLAQPERGQHERREAEEREGAVSHPRREQTVEHGAADQDQGPEHRGQLEGRGRGEANTAVTSPEDQEGGDHHDARGVAEPPRQPDGREAMPARMVTEREAQHADRRADRGAHESREDRELHDAAHPVEGVPPVRELRHEEGAEEGFERMAEGDAERRPREPHGRGGHQEGPQEEGGPHPIAPQQHRRQRDARGRPHHGRVCAGEGEQEPELPGDEGDAGESQEAPGPQREQRRRHRSHLTARLRAERDEETAHFQSYTPRL